ncbi:MAG: MEKHLA domain-containing protein [Cyanobacteria bacterium P01_A01_bin.114]
MTHLPKPAPDNDFLAEHVTLLRDSYRHLLGRDLISSALSALEGAKAIFEAPFIVVSHDASADPIFTYGNRAALELFEMSWAEFTSLPSRYSAEPMNRESRSQLLKAVSQQGFAENYSGVRISKTGRRFLIKQVTVWNLLDERHEYKGQAATYCEWSRV